MTGTAPARLRSAVVLAVAVSTSVATAAETECPAVNLLDQMAIEDSARHAAIRAEADRLPNGTGVFWRVEAQGVPPSWLFGTMHIADARVDSLPAPVADAFAAASVLAVEVADALDASTFAQLTSEQPELILAPPGGTLSEALSPTTVAALTEALTARGLSFAAFEQLQPWIAAAAFSVSTCEYGLQIGGNPTLDETLIRRAVDAGMQVVGLETLVSQLEAVSSLGRPAFLRSLESYADLHSAGLLEPLNSTMVALWLNEDVGAMLPLAIAFSEAGQAIGEDRADFERELIERRNADMLEAAGPLIEAGGAFIAVGAMHLPGEAGLIEGLRSAGYTVTRVPIAR